MATGHIGVKGIISLEESHETARKCKLYYSTARDAALRDANWNFATKIVALAKLNDYVPGWSFLYARPANCVKVRKVLDQAALHRPNIYDFRVMHAPTLNVPAIATNVELAWAEITHSVKDPNVFDAKFVEYLSYKLAGMLAIPLTGDQGLASGMSSMASSILSGSIISNATEGAISSKNYSPLIESRS